MPGPSAAPTFRPPHAATAASPLPREPATALGPVRHRLRCPSSPRPHPDPSPPPGGHGPGGSRDGPPALAARRYPSGGVEARRLGVLERDRRAGGDRDRARGLLRRRGRLEQLRGTRRAGVDLAAPLVPPQP